MRIETERLIITDFTLDMAQAVHENSLDEDNRRFVPDEVFETVEEARETIEYLMGQYGGEEGPFVHPVLLKTGENIGYVQLVNIGEGWELGYHIAKAYTGQGYATEAARAFLPAMAEKYHLDSIIGICLGDNLASVRVMEKLGFENRFTGVGPYQGAKRPMVKNIWKAETSRSRRRQTQGTEGKVIALRQFSTFDAAFLREKQMPDASMEEVLETIQAWGTKTFQGKPFEMFAVTADAAVVGSASLYGHTDEMASVGMEVFPEERGKGYGAEGMKLILEIARGRGYRFLQDQVRAENGASIALHEKLGFATDGYIYRNAKGREVLLYLLCL